MFAGVAGDVTVWNPFTMATDYFGLSGQPFMINLRVDDLDALLTTLAAKGVECVGTPLDEGYGKFGWIVDCDGLRIELWEPMAAKADTDNIESV